MVLGEPIFVASGSGTADNARTLRVEDEGYLLLTAFDPEHSLGLLLVLGAEDLEEVARLALPEPAPLGFHGLWVADME